MQRRIDVLFKGENREIVVQQLVERCGWNLPMTDRYDEPEFERFRFAVLKLSGGDMLQFQRAVELANCDRRDLLMAAVFGDVDAHKRWFAVSQEQHLTTRYASRDNREGAKAEGHREQRGCEMQGTSRAARRTRADRGAKRGAPTYRA